MNLTIIKDCICNFLQKRLSIKSIRFYKDSNIYGYMKMVKYTYLLLLVLAGCFVATSCSSDDNYYDVNSYLNSIVTLVPLEDGTCYMRSDKGYTFIPEDGQRILFDQENQRAFIYYNILSKDVQGYDYGIKLYRINPILTKQIIDLTEQNAAEIGNDPVSIESVWAGDDFLNIRFLYQTSTNASHLINLVNNRIEKREILGKDTIYLEFRHNANGSPMHYRERGLVAFDLKPYKRAAQGIIDTIYFVIKSNEEEIGIQYDIQ